MSIVEWAREALALQEMAVKLKEQRDGLVQQMFLIKAYANSSRDKPYEGLRQVGMIAEDAIKVYSETVKVER